MNRKLLLDLFGLGFLLWLIGYIFGIIFFMFLPPNLIGWVIMPIGVVITLWVLFKRVKSNSLNYYIILGVFWAIIAIVLDYFLLVKLFKPADGYYKLDVYLYYLFTFVLPLLTGFKKTASNK